MSCWVVPSVAAELWGISLKDVLGRVENGNVPTKTEYGFMLIDVAPNSPRLERRAAEPRPLTYTPLAPSPQETQPAEEEDGIEYEHGSLSWKERRQAVGRTRMAPKPNNLAA